ncbi:MAG: TIGR02281 family clan AA aspartic protease [Alteraurantiacibacter sp.]
MDMRIPLAAVLIAGGFLGLAAPHIADSGEASASGDAAESEAGATTLPVIAEPRSYGWAHSTALDREYDGHFYADTVVDGVPVRMLVDTGASVIALTGQDAAALGLYWGRDEVVPVAQGASGPVYGVTTSLSHVRVGEFEARNVEAMIIPEGLPISLLGQSFLSTVKTVRIEGDRLVLEN